MVVVITKMICNYIKFKNILRAICYAFLLIKIHPSYSAQGISGELPILSEESLDKGFPELFIQPYETGLILCRSDGKFPPKTLMSQRNPAQALDRVIQFIIKAGQNCIKLQSSLGSVAEHNLETYVIPEIRCMDTVEQEIQYFSEIIDSLDNDFLLPGVCHAPDHASQGSWFFNDPYYLYSSIFSHNCQRAEALLVSSGEDGDDDDFHFVLPRSHYVELSEDERIRLLKVAMKLLQQWGILIPARGVVQLFHLNGEQPGVRSSLARPKARKEPSYRLARRRGHVYPSRLYSGHFRKRHHRTSNRNVRALHRGMEERLIFFHHLLLFIVEFYHVNNKA